MANKLIAFAFNVQYSSKHIHFLIIPFSFFFTYCCWTRPYLKRKQIYSYRPILTCNSKEIMANGWNSASYYAWGSNQLTIIKYFLNLKHVNRKHGTSFQGVFLFLLWLPLRIFSSFFFFKICIMLNLCRSLIWSII